MANMNYSLIAVFLACSMSLAFGLQCHMCQTLADSTCNDYYTADNSDSCDDDSYCVKIKTIVWIRDSGYINGKEKASAVVTRDCASKLGKKEGCSGWQNNGGITIRCYCGSDNCNTGHSSTPKSIVALLGCLVTLFGLNMFLRH